MGKRAKKEVIHTDETPDIYKLRCEGWFLLEWGFNVGTLRTWYKLERGDEELEIRIKGKYE